MTELAATLRGSDHELFIINLCASMTPMPEVPRHLKGFERYKLYQVSRIEDGRRRYRLRLGFFASETDAELVLTSIRSLYPAAFSGCAGQEDQRHIDVYPATANNSQVALAADAPRVAQSVNPARTTAATAIVNATAQRTAPASTPLVEPASQAGGQPVNTPAGHSMRKPVTPPSKPTPADAANTAPPARAELTLADMPPVTRPTSTGESGVFHVGRGIEIPDIALELSPEPVNAIPRNAIPEIAPQPAPVAAPASQRPTTTRASQAAPARSPTPATGTSGTVGGAPVKPIVQATIDKLPSGQHDYIPILDTTLTIRTLTQSEAEDPNRPKWFAIQLATSEQPINLAAMPQLDIFAAYRVYSVALMEHSSIRHALRLGFFKEASSAEAVTSYLKTFFTDPTITQVSAAEHDRFAEPKKPAVKADASVHQLAPGRTAGNSVVVAPGKSQNQPVSKSPSTSVAPARGSTTPLKPRAAAPDAGGSARGQSFLSRLIGRQLD